MKRGQVWSVDAILGVFLFIIISIGVITFAFTRGQGEQVKALQEDGNKIFNWLSAGRVIEDKKLNPDDIKGLASMSYPELKRELGVSGDFCIYIVDEEGNIMYIDIDRNVTGIGSPKVLINGRPCNQSS
jgi:hypothetical protein